MLTNLIHAELHRLMKSAPFAYLAASIAIVVVTTVGAVRGHIDPSASGEGLSWSAPEPFALYTFAVPAALMAGIAICQFVVSNFSSGFITAILKDPRSRLTYSLVCIAESLSSVFVFLVLGWLACEATLRLGGYETLPVPFEERVLWLVQAFVSSSACIGIALLVGFATHSAPLSSLAVLATVLGLPSGLISIVLGALGFVERSFRLQSTPGAVLGSLSNGPVGGWTWLAVCMGTCIVAWTTSILVMRRRSLA